VVFGETGDALQLIDGGLRFFQRLGVDVGGVDQRALQQPFFTQHDGHGIGFLTGTAAGHPHFQRGIGAQQRCHFFPQGTEVGRIAEHLAHLHGEVVEQHGKNRRLVQHLVLQLR